MTLQSGAQARVSVSTATLWESPDVVRASDDPAVRTPVDIRGWVAGLDEADRTGDPPRVLTQLLVGERVVVDEVAGDWAKVIAVEQPSSLDPRGYPGWLSTSHVTTGTAGAGTAVVVDATATALRDAPFGDILLYGVTIGTRLVGTGATYRGWSAVLIAGFDEPAWVRSADVAPVSDAASTDDASADDAAGATAEDALQIAERFLDVPYVWGGISPYGLDCSGLVQLAYRRNGTVLPRDAADQAEATKEISLDEASPGDLYFFARPGKKIHHVAIVAGDRRMVHASQDSGRVVLEPLEGERAETLVAARRVLP
ncbi:MAG: NlpC/P60 family protein [Micromonosporaceae bacterium]